MLPPGENCGMVRGRKQVTDPMQYESIFPARFLARPNRFTALCRLEDGTDIVCHVRNTGRCAELLLPGAPVWLQRFGADAKRKTKFDLIAVQKGALLLNIDSQAPNAAAREFLASGGLGWIPSVLRPEYTWGDSRFDFYLEHGGRRCLAEVKGVTLEEDGTALFPDAPTLRGIKHLHLPKQMMHLLTEILFPRYTTGKVRNIPRRPSRSDH